MKVHAFVRVNAGRLIEYTSDQYKHKKGTILSGDSFLTIEVKINYRLVN